MPENKRNRRKEGTPPGFSLRFVIYSEEVELDTHPQAPVDQISLEVLIAVVLEVSGNTGRPIPDWRARTEAGAELDASKSPAALGLASGSRILLAPEGARGDGPGGDSSNAGPTAPAERAAESSVRDVPEWLEFRVIGEGEHVRLELVVLGCSPRTGPRLRPFQVRCDRCGQASPIFGDEELDRLGQQHWACGGFFRGCYRLVLNGRRQAFLVDGIAALAPADGTRAELVANAANDAELLLALLQDLAYASEKAGQSDTAAVYKRLGDDLRPVARILDQIAEHLRTVGAGLPPLLADFLAPLVEVGSADLAAKELSSGKAAAPMSLEEIARHLGVDPSYLRTLGETVKGGGGPVGALWMAAEDAARLAESLQRAAERSAGHPLAADALLPERLALFAAQVRQSLTLLKLARRVALVEPGQPIPEDLRGPLLRPPVRGRLVVMPTEQGRCLRCGAPLSAGDGLPDAPAAVCSTCIRPEASCTCLGIDEGRGHQLADELDAASVLLLSVGDLVRASLASVAELPAGDPVRLAVEALPERVEWLMRHVARAAGMLPGHKVEETAPPHWPDCNQQPPDDVEMRRREGLISEAAALARSEPPPEDPESLRMQLEPERCTLEGWSPGEGLWWAQWDPGHGGPVKAWLCAPTGSELLTQARWLNAQLFAARGGEQ